jgi:AcrR family transcriptional regulator
MQERRPSRPKAAKSAIGTRERILRAAVNEFAAKGYSGGRIEAICASARVNIRMIYHHFGGKEGRLISLLSGENLLKAKFLKRSKRTPVISSPVLAQLKRIIERGEAERQFREGIDALQLYVLIVSLSYFHLSNGYTLSVIFEQDIFKPNWLAQHKLIARDVVMRYVKLA